MDIQDIDPGPNLDPTRSNSVSDPASSSSTDDTSEAGQKQGGEAQDRAETSDEARTAQSTIQAELLRTQQALANATETRKDRVKAAQELVKAGHYTDPDVIADVAEQMVNDLFRQPDPEEGQSSQEL